LFHYSSTTFYVDEPNVLKRKELNEEEEEERQSYVPYRHLSMLDEHRSWLVRMSSICRVQVEGPDEQELPVMADEDYLGREIFRRRRISSAKHLLGADRCCVPKFNDVDDATDEGRPGPLV
jgi:hypothetical protein